MTDLTERVAEIAEILAMTAKAARDQALEEAAKVAKTCPGWEDSEASPERIAAAILAMKEKNDE